MSLNSSISEIFTKFQDYLNEDQDIRENIRLSVRDLEQNARCLLNIIQAVHQKEGLENVLSVCESCRLQFANVQKSFEDLQAKVPKDQYYRFNDHWRFVIQRLSFLVAFVVYLESEQIVSREDCAQILGVQSEREKGFHLDLDDYLTGLLLLASELSRLAVNAVTAGDYSRPVKIARFVAELDSGFRLLNLKNDFLRKRFDGLKYDLKKVEEVVYDISIRGLRPSPAEASAS